MAEVRKMGKKKNSKKRGFGSHTIYKYVRLVAAGAPIIKGVAQHGLTIDAGVEAVKGYTGVDLMTGQFNLGDAIAGWTPAAVATAFTYGVPKLAGMIRRL